MSSLSWVFRWDLPNKTVEMGQEKKDKYKDAFKELMSHATHTLDDIQKIYGKLLHTSLVATANSRTRLPHQLGSHAGNLQYKSSRFTPLTPRHQKRPPMVALLLQRRKKTFSQNPWSMWFEDYGTFADASSGFGIAIVIEDCWRAWRLILGWNTEGRDIGWAEAVVFEFLIHAVLSFSKPG